MKLKKSAVKYLQQKAKKSSKPSISDATAGKKPRPKGIKSKQGVLGKQLRRKEQLNDEDTIDSNYIKLKAPATKDGAGKRFGHYLHLNVTL